MNDKTKTETETANATGEDAQALEALAEFEQAEQSEQEQEAESLAGAVEQNEAKAEQVRLQEQADEQAARMGAAMAVGFMEAMVKAKAPYVVIDNDTKAQIIDKATPVCRKYGGGMPAWLQPYKEEIELGMVLAVAGFGVYGQVQQHKAEVRQLEVERRRKAAEQAERQQKAEQGGQQEAA